MSKLKVLQQALEVVESLAIDARKEVHAEWKVCKTTENDFLLSILENTNEYSSKDLLRKIKYFSSYKFKVEGCIMLNHIKKYEVEGTGHYFNEMDEIPLPLSLPNSQSESVGRG